MKRLKRRIQTQTLTSKPLPPKVYTDAQRATLRAAGEKGRAKRWAGTPGVCMNASGYLRHSAGPHRHKLVHRVIMAGLCAEFCVYPLDPKSGIPENFTVEHIDHIKTHNCTDNFLLLQKEIHDYLSCACWVNGTYRRDGSYYKDGEVDWRSVVGAAAEEAPPF